jgi:hypothetical protein
VHSKNEPYKNISELLQDKDRIDLLAETAGISNRNVVKDECGQWIIRGRHGRVETFDHQFYLAYVATYSARKWGALKRKAKALGWEITQDGHDEGCFRLALPNASQSSFLREILGLRIKRGRGQTKPAITDGSQPLKDAISDEFVFSLQGPATQVAAPA